MVQFRWMHERIPLFLPNLNHLARACRRGAFRYVFLMLSVLLSGQYVGHYVSAFIHAIWTLCERNICMIHAMGVYNKK